MTTKRFVKLQFIFVILLTLTLVCNTYSWASRPKVTGGGFMSEKNKDYYERYDLDKTYFTAMKFDTLSTPYYINGNSCTAVTYTGTANADGTVTYDETSGVTSAIKNVFATNAPMYFKTVITNSSDVPTNVSLFITGKVYQNIQSSIIGITSPVSTTGNLNIYGTTDIDERIAFDFTPVVSQYEIKANGTANIEWYILNNNQSGNTGYFEISEIILTNN